MSFNIVEKIISQRVLSIIRTSEKQKALDILRFSIAEGIFVNEVTLNTPNALEILAEIKREFPVNVAMGLGTVLNIKDVHSACDMQADFVVTPNLNLEVLKESVRLQMPIIPGCFTPSEMQAAYEHGASAIKLFPAGTLSALYVNSILAPLSHLKIIAVGGITFENAKSFLDAGAVAVGLGAQTLETAIKNGKNLSSLIKTFAYAESL